MKIIPPTKYLESERLNYVVSKIPDIREDIVSDLRYRLIRGSYKVTPDKVAEGIIRHGISIYFVLIGKEH